MTGSECLCGGRFSCGSPTGGVRSRRPPLAPGATTRPNRRPDARGKAICPPFGVVRGASADPRGLPTLSGTPPPSQPAFSSAIVAIAQRPPQGPGCDSPAAAGGHCAGAALGGAGTPPPGAVPLAGARQGTRSSQWDNAEGWCVQFERGTARSPRAGSCAPRGGAPGPEGPGSPSPGEQLPRPRG